MQFQTYLSKTTCPITSNFQTSYVFRVNTFDSRGDCCRNIEAFDFLGLARGWGVNRDRFSLFPIAFICDEPKSYQFFRRGLLRCALLYLRCGKVTSSSYSLLHPKSTPVLCYDSGGRKIFRAVILLLTSIWTLIELENLKLTLMEKEVTPPATTFPCVIWCMYPSTFSSFLPVSLCQRQ